MEKQLQLYSSSTDDYVLSAGHTSRYIEDKKEREGQLEQIRRLVLNNIKREEMFKREFKARQKAKWRIDREKEKDVNEVKKNKKNH